MWHVYAQGGRPDESPRGTGGFSAIRAAFDFPDLAVAELTAASLLGNGADPNVPQRDGSSALHAAASRGSFELVEMLLRKHADPSARDADGRTPRDLALAAGHADVAALLAHPERVPRDHSTSRRAYDASGAPYSPPDVSAFSILERGRVVGVSHTNFDAVREAVERNPMLVHSVATTTEGAVEASAHMGRNDMVDYLLEKGAPCSLPTAVMRNDLARAKALLEEDPDRVRERGPHDFALLWYPVIGHGLLEMAELLFAYGADVEQQHWLGTTALHYAAIGGQLDLGRLLIEKGADVNRAGRKFGGTPATPLQLAEGRKNDEFARLLRDHGASG
jgi:ankyrin repeat protein